MAAAITSAAGLTGDPAVDGLLQGGYWTFGSGSPSLLVALHAQWLEPGVVSDLPQASGTWTPALRAALARALAAWAAVADVVFQILPDGAPSGSAASSSADLAVVAMGTSLQGQGLLALAQFPDPELADAFLLAHQLTRSNYAQPEGDVVFADANPAFAALEDGGRGFAVMLHELGHALGLKHPDDDGGNQRPTFEALGIAALAQRNQTLMVDSLGTDTGRQDYPSTPMPLDILAIQQLYGANTTHHPGDDTYAVTLNGHGQTIWDAGGSDTLDASALQAGVGLDLRAGAVMALPASTVWALAYGMVIENVKGGAGPDTLQGNDAGNLLDGGPGFDTLRGGAGDDVYGVSDSADQVIELQDEGVDTVRSVASYTLPSQVENLALAVRGFNPVAGTGNALDNQLTGNLYANTLDGREGNDTVLGDLGDDSLLGGTGNDHLAGGPGADTLRGADGDDTLGGGKGNDSLIGGKGADQLGGARGNDLLTGGPGADLFVFSTPLDALDNVDTLADFEPGTDRLQLAASIFGQLAPFVGQAIGPGALLGYDPADGSLRYDADGAGPGTGTVFAILGTTTHPAALGTDLWVVA